MRVVPVLALALLLTLPATADAPLHQPAAAAFVAAGSQVAIVWAVVPGAEAYNVYGVSPSGTQVWLTDSDVNLALVDDRFPKYSITAVIGGYENLPTEAFGICIDVEPVGTVPPVGVSECEP